MKSVVLSTTEAEYVAVSEVVKEIKFLYQLLRSTEIKAPLPINITVENVGAIWLTNNSAHFVRSHVKDELATIVVVKSAENTSDIMTKNQQGIYFKSAQPKLVYMVKDMENTEKKVYFKINEQEEC